jgi:integrase/recombinase XerD
MSKNNNNQSLLLLKKSIEDYLLWMIDTGYAVVTWQCYERILGDFFQYIKQHHITWDNIFTGQTLADFINYKAVTPAPIKNLSVFLVSQGKISRPIEKINEQLPQVYEDYLQYYEIVKQVKIDRLRRARRLLVKLAQFLKTEKISLNLLKINHLDKFLKQYSKGYASSTQNIHRSLLRGFLSYIYAEHRLLSRNLAPLIVGKTIFAKQKPPRFLRPSEIKQLFNTFTPSSPEEIRTYAMLHLAHALGLRSIEITRISLDDISFRNSEITLPNRKGCNPIKLPLPQNAMKTIAAYVVDHRPYSKQRDLFLSHTSPHGPLSKTAVGCCIKDWLKKVGLAKASAYWLRHTYAKTLLEADISIFEIKEMMGHAHIQTTERYLTIELNFMRKVLFNETI